MTASAVDYAVSAARRGWVPVRMSVRSGKPMEKWKDLGPRTREQLGALRWSGVGVLTGPSDLVVIDLDPPDGIASFRELANGREIPATFVQRTPRGGWHYVFRSDGIEYKTQAGQIAPGIDVRGRGGLFKVYMGEDAPYTVKDASEPASLPEWLADILPLADEHEPDPDFTSDGEIVPPGEQHDFLARAAWQMRCDGMPKSEAWLDWRDLLDRCPLGDENDPWTKRHFSVMWSGANTKLNKTERDLAGLDEAVQELIAKQRPSSNGHKPGKRKLDVRHFVITEAATTKPRPVIWAWRDRMPLGELTITGGPGGAGKSTFQDFTISRITRGKLPGCWYGTPRNCLIVVSEESWERTIVPRLIAAGADLEHVARVEMATKDAGGLRMQLPRDYAELEQAIQFKHAAYVFFDSLMGSISGKTDVYKPNEARDAIQPLPQIADRNNAVISGNAHLTKASNNDPISRILGSVEFSNVPRAVIMFAHDKETDARIMSCEKNNLGTMWPSREFEIISHKFMIDDDEYDIGKFIPGDETDLDVRDILSRKDRPHPIRNECADVLRGMFEHKAEWLAEEAKEEIKRTGGGWDKDTIRRAREMMGIRIERTYKSGPGGGIDHVYWTNKPRA